jgi:hypothetical protein
MGQAIYWHNITKGEYNINCIIDASESCAKGDKIMISCRGNALMIDLETLSDGEDIWSEYEYAKQEFLELYKNVAEEDFY